MSRLSNNDPLNKWTLVLTETLPDSRGQVESIFIGPIIFGSTIKPSQRCSDLIDVALCDGDGVAVIILVFSIENSLVIAASLAIHNNRSISEFGQFVVKGILHEKIFYRLNLIFWIVMGCGIARFGRKGLKTTET